MLLELRTIKLNNEEEKKTITKMINLYNNSFANMYDRE